MKLLRYGPPAPRSPACSTPTATFATCPPWCATSTAWRCRRPRCRCWRRSTGRRCRWCEGTPRIGPCVARPVNFVCIGLNYADHAAETGAAIPKEPIMFLKSLGAFCGPNDDVMIPRGSKKTDWEVELGVVIGTTRALCAGERGDGSRRRLLRRQRRERARIPDRARRHLGQGQGLRHVRPDRPVAGHQGRNRRPAEPGACGWTWTASACRTAAPGR